MDLPLRAAERIPPQTFPSLCRAPRLLSGALSEAVSPAGAFLPLMLSYLIFRAGV